MLCVIFLCYPVVKLLRFTHKEKGQNRSWLYFQMHFLISTKKLKLSNCAPVSFYVPLLLFVSLSPLCLWAGECPGSSDNLIILKCSKILGAKQKANCTKQIEHCTICNLQKATQTKHESSYTKAYKSMEEEIAQEVDQHKRISHTANCILQILCIELYCANYTYQITFANCTSQIK